MAWTPKPKDGVRLHELPLNAEEGYVLSRVDGRTTVDELALLTGFPGARVQELVSALVRKGALQPDASAPGAFLDEATLEGVPPLPDPTEEEAPLDAADDLADGEVREESDDQPSHTEVREDDDETRTGRALFETTLKPLHVDERAALARTAAGEVLLALCFDPQPSVISAVLENSAVGLVHARTIARHHRTSHGLDVVAQRAEFLRDGQVQRELLRNPILPEPLLKRLTGSKRFVEVYKLALDRDLPERTRQKLRLALRSKWALTSADERAEVVFQTEGRVLGMLQGLPFDAHTTSLLCARTYNSTLLIQNLARFSATPPQLLLHLMKQMPVKRQEHLRRLLTQHPNCPGEARRRG